MNTWRPYPGIHTGGFGPRSKRDWSGLEKDAWRLGCPHRRWIPRMRDVLRDLGRVDAMDSGEIAAQDDAPREKEAGRVVDADRGESP